MSESTRRGTYYITDTDETIGRLIRNSQLQGQNVRDGFRRTGLGLGDTVLDVGCGPLGGLLDLSDLVGPQGTVVGVDVDEGSLRRARAILDRAGRENVRLVHANVNAEPSDQLRGLGPFDAAYCRLFLLFQQDPATLQWIAALLRPGGHIVAHELLLDGPLLRSEPAVPEIEQVLRWAREIGLNRGETRTWPASSMPSVHEPACERCPSVSSAPSQPKTRRKRFGSGGITCWPSDPRCCNTASPPSGRLPRCLIAWPRSKGGRLGRSFRTCTSSSWRKCPRQREGRRHLSLANGA